MRNPEFKPIMEAYGEVSDAHLNFKIDGTPLGAGEALYRTVEGAERAVREGLKNCAIFWFIYLHTFSI